MSQYAQHYLSTQQSHRLLAYKPSTTSQSQAFISPTGKRSRSPSSHMYSSHVPQIHTSKLMFFRLSNSLK